MGSSGVIKGIITHVCVVVGLSTLIAVYNSLQLSGQLPAGFPVTPTIAMEPVQLSSFALSLLLVFRTNASYSRWLEAREKFGSITTTSRDLLRQSLWWFSKDDKEGRTGLARWLKALVWSSMCHLRDGEHDLRSVLKDILEPEELEMLLVSPHRPNFCVQMITKTIARAKLPTELVLRMDEGVSSLVSAVAACERILNSPVPISYTRHTARCLMIWLLCLPFSLWSYCGWAMIGVSALISFVLLGIEEIGVYIEEPFSLLPLESLCDKLCTIVGWMVKEHDSIEGKLDLKQEQEGAGASLGMNSMVINGAC